MICTSLQHKTYDQILSILDDPFVEMAEIRLDLCELSIEELEDIISTCEKPLIITMHKREGQDDNAYWAEYKTVAAKAAEAGADYLDLDLSAPAPVSQYFRKLCGSEGVKLIRSYHDYCGTPDSGFISQTILRAFRYGADIAKIACKADTENDVKTLQQFYGQAFEENPDITPDRLILISMGEKGTEARLDCLAQGAPFTYAYYDTPTAEGQWEFEEMHKALYGDWLGVHKKDFHAPCSKSFAQRAIIAAALADGTSRLSNFGICQDTLNAVDAAKALGAKVTRRGSTLKIEGISANKDNKLSINKLNVGESGLLARLTIPILAALDSISPVIEGKGTLLQRPLVDAQDIMASFGVILSNATPSDQTHIPLTVNGYLIPGNAEIPGTGGSQLISGLLMALPLCESRTRMHISEPKSIPYMFMTLDILKKFGIKIACELEGDAQMIESQDWSACEGIDFTIKAPQRYKAADIELEGDWSAAACFLTYGALFGEAEVTGLNTNSVQADITILDVLNEAGANLAYDDDIVSVKRAPLNAFKYDLNHAPDLFPIVALLAAFCPGESRISGIKRLIAKECNRAEAILTTLKQMGVDAGVDKDDLIIEGISLSQRMLRGELLKGGNYSSFHDHRMVMMLAIAEKGADSPITIDDRECVCKSFPDFFEELTL